ARTLLALASGRTFVAGQREVDVLSELGRDVVRPVDRVALDGRLEREIDPELRRGNATLEVIAVDRARDVAFGAIPPDGAGQAFAVLAQRQHDRLALVGSGERAVERVAAARCKEDDRTERCVSHVAPPAERLPDYDLSHVYRRRRYPRPAHPDREVPRRALVAHGRGPRDP